MNPLGGNKSVPFILLYTLTDSDGMRADNITRTVIVYPKPTLEFSTESAFLIDGNPENRRGTDRVKATADEEAVTFKVVYTDASEPPAVKVEAVMEENIDRRRSYSGINLNTAIITQEQPLELTFPSGAKEKIRINLISSPGSSLTVKAEAFNSGNILLEEKSAGISAGTAWIELSLQSNGGDISRLKVSTEENFVTGSVQVAELHLTEAYTMVPDPSVHALPLNGENYKEGVQFRTLRHFPHGRYSYYFRANNGRKLITFPEEPLPLEAGYSNVVFLPGIQASRLYEGDIRLWEPNPGTNIHKLSMELTEEGGSKSKYPGINAQVSIDEGYGIFNIYQSFLTEMDQWKEEGIVNDWAAIPYDWRLEFDQLFSSGIQIGDEINYADTPFTEDPYIIKRIEEMMASSANGRVTIVAHSMGGLVAKKLFATLEKENSPRSNNILKGTENFIMVASPQLGTPKAIASLLHGEGQDVGKGLLMNKFDARRIGEFMPGAFSLLPSEMYMNRVRQSDENGWTYTHGKIVEFHNSLSIVPEVLGRYLYGTYGSSITDYATLTKFLEDRNYRTISANPELRLPISLHTALLEGAKKLHGTSASPSGIDYWTPPPGMNVTQIAGWGIPDTIRGVNYSIPPSCFSTPPLNLFCEVKFDYQPLFTMDGDETVVTPSAIAMRDTTGVGTYYVDMMAYNSFHIIKRSHGSILEIPSISSIIRKRILHAPVASDGSSDKYLNNDDLNYISLTKPVSEDKYIRLALHSPVAIDIFDSTGRHTGATYDPADPTVVKNIEEQIPNSYFVEFGEGKYLGIPAGENYQIKLRGLAEGVYTLELTEVLGDQNIGSQTYKNLPTSPDMKAEVTLTTLEDSTDLKIDANGDGTFEKEILPIERDTLAPTSTITTEGKLWEDWLLSEAKITLTAADNENGSGVIKTEYSLDGGNSWQEYEEPFAITAAGDYRIFYRSTDASGNQEEAKTTDIKITTAKYFREIALARLQSLPQADKWQQRNLEEIILSIEGTLQPEFWIDANHLTTQKGSRLYAEDAKIMGTIRLLQQMKGGKLVGEESNLTLTQVMHQLFLSERLLLDLRFEEIGSPSDKLSLHFLDQAKKFYERGKELEEANPLLAVVQYGLSYGMVERLDK